MNRPSVWTQVLVMAGYGILGVHGSRTHAQVNSLGACCLADKGCVETTSEGCNEISGGFKGEGTYCEEECPHKVSTAFTYHGQLKQSGVPYTGPTALEFSLWDLPNNGQLIAGPITVHNVSVTNGLFRTLVDFGEGKFGPSARWLEVAVCTAECGLPGAYTLLQPRQPITAVPFAMQTRGIVVDEQGNVGIQTIQPEAPLHVAGNLRAKELHLANHNGLPMARWDGTRVEPGPDQIAVGLPPTTVTTVAGSPAWTNPSALLVSDDLRAELSMTQSGEGPTQKLRITGFGFSIPEDAIVTQAILHVEGSRTCSCPSCSGKYALCFMNIPARLISDALSGTTYSVAPPFGVEAVDSVGFPAEMDWTPAMYNAPGFGIELEGDLYFGTTCYFCDFFTEVCGCECSSSCPGLGSVSIDSVNMELKYHQSVVVDRQWAVGMASPDSRFVIAPSADLSTPSITILTDGKIGLGGITAPFYGLELPNTSTANKGRAIALFWHSYSSKRWKENIRAIPGALDKLLRLQGVFFDWKAEQGGETDIGFVAEDVANVLPELVTMEPDGQSAVGMKYDRVTALAVEAIKELHSRQKQNEAELKTLLEAKDRQIEELHRRLERLENSTAGKPTP